MQQNRIESGVQMLSRINPRPQLDGIYPSIFPNGGPLPNQTIEISANEEYEKDQFIIDIIVRCILPPDLHHECKGSGVILIITEFKINVFHVVKSMEKFMKKAKIDKKVKCTIIENALKNLILLKCYTPEQLECSFYNLERLIYNRASISLVIMDNIASFYWRAKSEKFMLSYTQHSINNYKLLQGILRNLHVVLLFGNTRKNVKSVDRFAKEVNIQIDLRKSEGSTNIHVTDFDNNKTICVTYIK